MAGTEDLQPWSVDRPSEDARPMTAISAAGAMPVSQLIGDEVVRVAADATLRDVAVALTGGALGAVVLGHEGRPAALVSERDLARSVASGDDPASTAASTVASRE